MADDAPRWVRAARDGWTNTGARRPDFALEPAEGQESVWDYPRPPAIVPDERLVVVGDTDDPLASTRRAVRVLETASPPTFYVPLSDVRADRLVATDGSSVCEWKGRARYWALAERPDVAIAWDYPEPYAAFADIVDHFAFYPGKIRCSVDGEVVRAQAGGFYGGWITDDVVGPFKGEPGTRGW
jgi:uncharacterized protein (DUF427 family)